MAGAGADERRRKRVFIIAGAKSTESQTETDFGSEIGNWTNLQPEPTKNLATKATTFTIDGKTNF